jgi:RNA polymerase sigma factor (sigma-70 family)
MEDKLMEEQESKYTVLVNKKRVAVGREVYKAYYRQKEREAYLDKLASKHNISFEECEEKGIQVDYLLSRTEESIEDGVIKKEMLEKLALCLETLSEQERLLIYALFFQGKSERQLSAETGTPQRTINDRKRRILLKLKKLLEK